MKANLVLILIVFTCLRMPLAADGAEPVAKADTAELKRAVIANYAAVASASYQDSLATAKKLQKAVEALLAEVSEENLAAAQRAWLSA